MGPNADQRFVNYYAEQSASAKTQQRFEGVRRVTLRVRAEVGESVEALDVVDIGCGAGTQTLLWASEGHRARGIDISAPLIELARSRATELNQRAEFQVGSATKLGLPDASSDVVLVSELLEHLADWESCMREAVRILRPGGVLYVSTTNWLCPVQQEFDLPLYSWYPGAVKRRCEKLAVTTHGHWVQHTSFPAVHWFSFFQLQRFLREYGLSSSDRFDVMETEGSRLRGAVVGAVRKLKLVRFAAHVLTPYTIVVAHRPRQPIAA